MQMMQRSACGCAFGSGAAGEAPRAELNAAPLLDLENGWCQRRHTVVPTAPALDAQDDDAEMEKAATRIIKCIFRGLIILLWVYLIDLMRRYVTTHSIEELFFTLCPLGILVLAVSMFFCILMGCIDEYVTPKSQLE